MKKLLIFLLLNMNCFSEDEHKEQDKKLDTLIEGMGQLIEHHKERNKIENEKIELEKRKLDVTPEEEEKSCKEICGEVLRDCKDSVHNHASQKDRCHKDHCSCIHDCDDAPRCI